jgi:hypothetical protein
MRTQCKINVPITANWCQERIKSTILMKNIMKICNVFSQIKQEVGDTVIAWYVALSFEIEMNMCMILSFIDLQAPDDPCCCELRACHELRFKFRTPRT